MTYQDFPDKDFHLSEAAKQVEMPQPLVVISEENLGSFADAYDLKYKIQNRAAYMDGVNRVILRYEIEWIEGDESTFSVNLFWLHQGVLQSASYHLPRL